MRDKIDKAISLHNTFFSNTIIEFESLSYFISTTKFSTKESGNLVVEGYILSQLDMFSLADLPETKLEMYPQEFIKKEIVKKEFHKDHKYIIHHPLKNFRQ